MILLIAACNIDNALSTTGADPRVEAPGIVDITIVDTVDADTAPEVDSGADAAEVTVAAGCACPTGFLPTPDASQCVREATVAATSNGATMDVCEGERNEVYGKFGALYPDGLNVQSNYWGDDDGSADGRLNKAGIWGCDSVPNGEWIGLATCVELATAGDYIVGIAGDNKVKLRVDGIEVFSETSGVTAAFNYWYLLPLSLDAGAHRIEIYGENDGSIASFGAEVAGPWSAGSLTTDAAMAAVDYQANLVFTTADRVGSSFQLGTTSGWSCPDGYALDACSDEPECVETEVVECL